MGQHLQHYTGEEECTFTQVLRIIGLLVLSYPGTLVRFHGGSNMKWQDVDDLDSTEEDSADEGQSLKVRAHQGVFHSITVFNAK